MKTHEIFRFLNLRPVQKSSEQKIASRFYKYDKVSPLHQKIKQMKEIDAREKSLEFAKSVLIKYVDVNQIDSLIETARKICSKEKVKDAKGLFKSEIGKDVKEWLASDVANKLKEILWDCVYAHTLLPEEKPHNRETIFNGIRVFYLFDVLSNQKDDEKPIAFSKVLEITPIIPKEIFPAFTPQSKSKEENEKIVNELLKEWKIVKDKIEGLTKSIVDIKNNDRFYKAKELQAGTDPKLAEMGIGIKAIDIKKIQIKDSSIEFALGKGVKDALSTENSKIKLEMSGFVLPRKSPWLFEKFGEKNLSKDTLKLLVSMKDEMKEKEVSEVIASLEKERYQIVKEFLAKLPKWICEYIHLFVGLEVLELLGIPSFRCKPKPPSNPQSDLNGDAATSKGGIKPLGIGDLLIVKEELQFYTVGEVAHIENVLKSEYKARNTTQLRELEEITVAESETSQESEKDLQTTDRFELQKETQKSIETEMKIDAGLSVTGGYGPVSVTAHADFALTQSTSESNKTASSYAKQTVERSVSKITQRVREERKIRILERFEEKNEHTFDNRAGTGHVIGIYRWVDKNYKARLINYGKRMMMEFIVPEPAAFYLQVQELPVRGFTAKRPQEPMIYDRPLKPSDLNKLNYGDFVAAYNVQDAEAYPSDTIKVSVAYGEVASQGSNVVYSKVFEKLTIPNGYVISDIYGANLVQGYSGSFGYCTLGGEHWDEHFGYVSCNGLEGVIPFAFSGYVAAFHYNIVAVCTLKESAKTTWQLKTYQSIMNAYYRALAEYNEQLAAANVRTGVEIEGRNPELNRKIESDELKKGALRLLTNNFAKTSVDGSWRLNEQFNSMKATGEFGYPEFNIDEAIIDGKIIQFFEQSFEWNNMTYRFYPYVWGRKSEWNEIFPLKDVDPKFTDFLRAGAARVIVPVQPNYTEVMLHYLGTNEIWNGGNPPTLDDPLFISIANEIKAETGANIDNEIDACSIDSGYPCLVDEWEVKVPTSLVYLQEDSKLPDNTEDGR